MRIICDHCERPISGTVKQLAGNFNLHPDCMTELGKETRHKSPAFLLPGHQPLVSALDCDRAAPRVSRQM